jgi:DNA polymerase-3 subunit epsilon
MAAHWYDGTLAGLDIETTGFDGKTDHLVQFSLQVHIDADCKLTRTGIINPGVPILNSEIHGITDEIAASGIDEESAVKFISGWIEISHYPLVVMNARFDMTFLRDLMARYGYALKLPAIIDPMVIDRQLDMWRPGKRKLADLAITYEVPFSEGELHDAGVDCALAIDVARAIGRKFRIGDAGALHEAQKIWSKSQVDGLREYWQRIGNEDWKTLKYGWPVVNS